MNTLRILRVTSCYLFLTGYQIRWYDRKSLHYRLTVGGIVYHVIIFFLYLVCFCHHFESSAIMKILLDMSPFLKDLVRVQVLLGLLIYIFCAIEAKNLTNIFNRLINIFMDSFERMDTFDISELAVYLLFFATLLVAIAIGMYIAIELKFELPTVDQTMISMALFMPHLTLAGCLRLYTLGLWLIRRELVINETYLKNPAAVINSKTECNVVIEMFNTNTNSSGAMLYEIYEKISRNIDNIADYLNVFDRVLQRQLSVLVGMNFNCLLAGAYAHVYFENIWKILFSNRNRRIFYAANSAIIICILVDYTILLYTQWSFHRTKQNLYNLVTTQLFANKQFESDVKIILKYIKRKLSKELRLKLFGLIDFNTWNFLILQGLMLLLIALIVSNQYFGDQIKALNERLDVNDSE